LQLRGDPPMIVPMDGFIATVQLQIERTAAA
jgi:hypothetical protein